MTKKIKPGDRVIVVFETKVAKESAYGGNCLCTSSDKSPKIDLDYLQKVVDNFGGQLIKVSK